MWVEARKETVQIELATIYPFPYYINHLATVLAQEIYAFLNQEFS